MQQFVVPQFIDEESHILGPIAVRQFLIMLVVGFLVFLSYRLADTSLFIILTILFVVSGIVLAFVRINGRPFHYFLLNLIQTLQRPRLRVWRKEYGKQDQMAPEIINDASVSKVTTRRPPPTISRLAELSLVVDTGGIYHGDNAEKGNS
ncbi:hypothetical protein COV04_00160 [Candidatus Uhrbacteria bacterium CG10_big_fil_rev_8_21_14_0_10_48_11]|uniref:PrgI family protein n=1 Tax=Candidatus Uhrbacteria bacterium CG10_big_fil_rev_8_21_14_0_10_48_11 TaxID=1975037 RepID=A0A2M8LFP9_9BACT|nr:MAG: hypothetical protein COV04_00160 [Candidatus Uhrbacteria bacterium CG10_big_fil_rev_8_21_14_0_10_48_11]